MKWVRAKDGAIFGVCKGIARGLDLSVGVVRLLFILSVLFLGVGFLFYLGLAICLPREDKTVEALEPWILGVCSKIALKTSQEVGIIRFLALLLFCFTAGATLVGYVVLYFILDEKPAVTQSSDSKPSTPPSTT
jgi:phage shock protein PspC (stress-responsive transcriptional regulator)